MDPTLHSLGYVTAMLMLAYQVLRWAGAVAEQEEQNSDF